MQHCFHNLRYVSNWTLVESAKTCEILNVNAFGDELTRGWNNPFTYMNNITCITQYNGRNKIFLLKYEIPCLIFYTSRSTFICFPYPIYPYRSSTIWIWKFAKTVTTTITSAVFIKFTCIFVILVLCPSGRWSSRTAYARVILCCCIELVCKQKGVLEEKVILISVLLPSLNIVNYNHATLLFSFLCDSNWTLVEYAKTYKILNVNEFGAELT